LNLSEIKIVSGGQTGVDRAALNVAIEIGLAHGGWCPKGRRAEDGRIPRKYKLRETDNRDYAVRTEKNVVDSDATLVLYFRQISGGTNLTLRIAKQQARHVIAVDLDCARLQSEAQRVRDWIESNRIGVLNVAGPRESNAKGVGLRAEWFLDRVFTETTAKN